MLLSHLTKIYTDFQFFMFKYYATVDASELNPSCDNIMWLTLDNIEEKDSLIIADLPDMVGSGQSVGWFLPFCPKIQVRVASVFI